VAAERGDEVVIGITAIQMQTWAPSGELVQLAQRASRRFETVLLTDQFQSRNAYALMGAMAAHADVGVGTCVTFPFGRSPIEVASAFATLRELVPAGREVLLGLGTGGALVSTVAHTRRPVERVRELIACCRDIWSGNGAALADYPVTVGAGDLRDDCTVSLNFDADPEIPIVLTGTGPKILELAGETADGFLVASNFPQHSLAAFRTGRFGEVSRLDAVDNGRVRSDRPDFRRIYGINISVSKDRDAAKAGTRKQAALIVGQQPDENLVSAGIDPERCAPVKAAFAEGRGVAGAADVLPQDIADSLIISGTPADCIEGLSELYEHINRAGFTEAYIGAPIGPDVAAAVDLLADIVIPAVVDGP
jgi:5,10-methylenetetrahydromethanopterin reductase